MNDLRCQFNALSSICAVSILNAPDEEERLNVLIKTIQLGDRLRKVWLFCFALFCCYWDVLFGVKMGIHFF